MGHTARGLGSYFDELQAIKAAQRQILDGARAVLVANEKRLAEALGIGMNLRSAKEALNPTRVDKIDEEEAWVGYDVKPGNDLHLSGFYLGLYFEPAEESPGEVGIYAYGALAVSNKDQRENLWRLVEVTTSWDFERNKADWSAELYKKLSHSTAEGFTEVLQEIVQEWCEIGKKFGGVQRALLAKP